MGLASLGLYLFTSISCHGLGFCLWAAVGRSWSNLLGKREYRLISFFKPCFRKLFDGGWRQMYCQSCQVCGVVEAELIILSKPQVYSSKAEEGFMLLVYQLGNGWDGKQKLVK